MRYLIISDSFYIHSILFQIKSILPNALENSNNPVEIKDDTSTSEFWKLTMLIGILGGGYSAGKISKSAFVNKMRKNDDNSEHV